MDFFDVVGKRHSVRSYQDKEVEEVKLGKILSAIKRTPSAGGLRSFRVEVVKDKTTKGLLTGQTFGRAELDLAPVLLVFLADLEISASKYGERGRDLYCVQDATIAAAYSQLAATALGLSSVWVGAFHEKEVGEILGAKENERPVAIIVLGYEM
ncbi:MAG: nitroreductase family protein [Candidatus Diapherotrites archaeon]